MKHNTGLHVKRDKAAGFTAALILHCVVLYGLWSYHIIPPQSEALTVFVSYINPASPAKTVQQQPLAPKPAPVQQEAPRTVIPVAAPLLSSLVPAVLPVQPVVPSPPVAKTIPTPVISPVVSGPPAVPKVATVPQPLLLSGELSVSCTERTPPSYPKQSLRLGEQGKTVLLVELDELGRVINIDVKTKSGFPRLDEAAINAVKSWRCSPAKRNGVAVRSVALQPFNFSLKGR
jgi:protein TonB